MEPPNPRFHQLTYTRRMFEPTEGVSCLLLAGTTTSIYQPSSGSLPLWVLPLDETIVCLCWINNSLYAEKSRYRAPSCTLQRSMHSMHLRCCTAARHAGCKGQHPSRWIGRITRCYPQDTLFDPLALHRWTCIAYSHWRSILMATSGNRNCKEVFPVKAGSVNRTA